MRFALYAAVAALALSACSKPAPTPQAAMVGDALDAYVKGDRPGFETFVAKADAEAATAQAVPDYDKLCTQAASDARRAVAVAEQLHGLDASPVFSMSDEARYVFLSAAYTDANRYFENGGGRPGCEKSDHEIYYDDIRQRRVMVGELYQRQSAWEATLRHKSPADFEQRINTAMDQLELNHMGRFSRMRGSPY